MQDGASESERSRATLLVTRRARPVASGAYPSGQDGGGGSTPGPGSPRAALRSRGEKSREGALQREFAEITVGGVAAGDPDHRRRRPKALDHLDEVTILRHHRGSGHPRAGEDLVVLQSPELGVGLYSKGFLNVEVGLHPRGHGR